MEPGNESRDLPHIEAPSTPKTGSDADVARLIQNVGATSIAEFEKLIGELQEVKNFLQSEGERIRQETARYMNLTQMASTSVKIIFDTGMARGGPPHAQSVHSMRIRDHALPGRGQYRLTIRIGAKLPGAPAGRGSYLCSWLSRQAALARGKPEWPAGNSDATRGSAF
jgi:hypothetical protein